MIILNIFSPKVIISSENIKIKISPTNGYYLLGNKYSGVYRYSLDSELMNEYLDDRIISPSDILVKSLKVIILDQYKIHFLDYYLRYQNYIRLPSELIDPSKFAFAENGYYIYCYAQKTLFKLTERGLSSPLYRLPPNTSLESMDSYADDLLLLLNNGESIIVNSTGNTFKYPDKVSTPFEHSSICTPYLITTDTSSISIYKIEDSKVIIYEKREIDDTSNIRAIDCRNNKVYILRENNMEVIEIEG